MRRLVLIHPLLFAWMVPLALLSHNIETAPPYTAIRAMVVAAGLALAVVLALRVLGFRWPEAAFLASIAALTSSVFGNILQLIGGLPSGPGALRLHLASAITFGGLMAAFVWWTRTSRSLSPAVHLFLVLVGGVSIVSSVVRIVSYENLVERPLVLPETSAALERARPTAPPTWTPDIYYIIVDGYGRDDVLQEIYGLDNREFIQDLERRGFYVAPAARSNYSQTSLSLASSMNMSYLDELKDLPDVGLSQSYVTRLFRHNEVLAVLRTYGYRIVSIPVAYNRTLLPSADVSYDYAPRAVNSFESLLLENSILWSPFVLARAADPAIPFPGYASRRESILANQAAVEAAIPIAGPKFVFAHLAVPHPPFVFDQNGRPAGADHPYREQDGDQFLGTVQEYLEGYRAQVLFTNGWVESFLDRLDEQGRPGAVVIFQGDHGPGSGLHWLDPAQTDFRERHSILNAMRIPGLDSQTLEPSASPVNTFRVVFNYLFGASYPRLPDRSYFSSWVSPYSFIPVPEFDLARGQGQ